MSIHIGGMDKAAVLVALYERARAQGLGVIVAAGNKTAMTLDRARALLAEETYFDYVDGRVMKIDLSDDELRTHLYDRDNGQGAAEAALRDAGLLAAQGEGWGATNEGLGGAEPSGQS